MRMIGNCMEDNRYMSTDPAIRCLYWRERAESLKQQLELQKAIGNGFSSALMQAEQQLAELRELTQRMYTHVTEDLGEMTSAEFDEWMTQADSALKKQGK